MAKNTEGDFIFDCYSCEHSKMSVDFDIVDVRLRCAKTGKIADRRCEQFEYCPGTDQWEIGK